MSGIYPTEKQTFINRVQAIINAYYENDSGMPREVGSDTAADDVDRLSMHLSSFPKCINEYIDTKLVSEIGVNLPEDDIKDLMKKHEEKCRIALENVRKAINTIENYASVTSTPHLFMESELEDLTDEKLLSLIVNVITDMYGEDRMDAEEYIDNLVENKQHLDVSLLELE